VECLPNGITLRPTALTGCMSVTDGLRDGHAAAVGSIIIALSNAI